MRSSISTDLTLRRPTRAPACIGVTVVSLLISPSYSHPARLLSSLRVEAEVPRVSSPLHHRLPTSLQNGRRCVPRLPARVPRAPLVRTGETRQSDPSPERRCVRLLPHFPSVRRRLTAVLNRRGTQSGHQEGQHGTRRGRRDRQSRPASPVRSPTGTAAARGRNRPL